MGRAADGARDRLPDAQARRPAGRRDRDRRALAFAAGALLGLSALVVGTVVLVGLLAGSVRGLRAETTTAAATALVVLTTGYSDDGGMLVARLLDTGIGIVVGLLVNLFVWPPLRDRSAAHLIGAIDDRIGALLCDIAGGTAPRRRARASTTGSPAPRNSTRTSPRPGACSARRARAGG